MFQDVATHSIPFRGLQPDDAHLAGWVERKVYSLQRSRSPEGDCNFSLQTQANWLAMTMSCNALNPLQGIATCNSPTPLLGRPASRPRCNALNPLREIATRVVFSDDPKNREDIGRNEAHPFQR